jgi:hypothetical protein
VPRALRADAQRNVGSLLKAAKAVFAAVGVDAPAKEIANLMKFHDWRQSAEKRGSPQALGRPRDPYHDGLGARRQMAFSPMRSSSAPPAENPGSADARLRGSCGASHAAGPQGWLMDRLWSSAGPPSSVSR